MELFAPPRAAKFMLLSERTLERHRQFGSGPKFVRLGRRVFYRREDLEAWVTDCTCRSTSEADVKIERRKKRHSRSDPPAPPSVEIAVVESERDRARDKIEKLSTHTASPTGAGATE